ncbi:MAG: 30S ribosomal protein S16 [Candidatus Yonathbacteria bacterium]|nr:30S ribosomal protein S16 [Candidatus Yonathbacteria bacterium]
MLKIRLQRVGRKHDPSFRLVLTDSKNGPQSGKFLEVLGSYNARFGKPEIKGDRVIYWVSKGAQVSDTVHNLLINEKIIEGKKINVLPRKSPVKKEGEEVAEKTKIPVPEKAVIVEEEAVPKTEDMAQTPEVSTESAEPAPVAEKEEEKKE